MERGAPSPSYNHRRAEEVFRDYRGRRAGLVKALTTESESFYQLCDPEKENLCLYGLPEETWQVTVPAEEVPPEIPEPVLGINFARDGMDESDWLALVAVHSDSWLLAVAFYFAARFGFDKNERKRLFQMINSLPTIFEVVTAPPKKQPRERISCSTGSGKNKSNSKHPESDLKPSEMYYESGEDGGQQEGNDDEEEDEHSDTLCGACGYNYGNDEFWICCDVCERWFHGKCVKITPARAEHIKHYKCPGCTNNKRTKL